MCSGAAKLDHLTAWYREALRITTVSMHRVSWSVVCHDTVCAEYRVDGITTVCVDLHSVVPSRLSMCKVSWRVEGIATVYVQSVMAVVDDTLISAHSSSLILYAAAAVLIIGSCAVVGAAGYYYVWLHYSTLPRRDSVVICSSMATIEDSGNSKSTPNYALNPYNSAKLVRNESFKQMKGVPRNRNYHYHYHYHYH